MGMPGAPAGDVAPTSIILPLKHRMSWLSRLLGGKSDGGLKPQRLDYLNEALALERQGDFDAALTSYRLALRDHPNDPRILQNMAIAFSRTGRLEDAVRAYRRALELDPQLSGAHYGLAFLHLKRGEPGEAMSHLQAFLDAPPSGAEADRWVRHARQTLDELRSPPADPPSEQPEA
ncbi:MAG: tetratricopeptide repeat protein [Gemmatimonadaceae bacterium]